MTDHQPLPVKGYTPQSDAKTRLADEGKELEERVLRYIEKVQATVPQGETARYLALGKTNAQNAFMWTIRAIFNPQRIALPEDHQP